MKFTQSMFDSIKQSLDKHSSGNFKDILKTEPGNTYVVRLLPNLTQPDRTFHHYFMHGWTSTSTGQYVSTICPTTYGERCPACEERLQLYKENTDESKAKAALLKRKENWLVNVYVVKDPKKSENDNTVKIFRYGKQVDKIIKSAIEGEDAAEFGASIFDLSENGCNFRIKVEKNEGDYPTYVSSKFLSKSKIDAIKPDEIDKVYEKAFELDKFFETKTIDQIKDMINDHLNGSPKIAKSTPKAEKAEVKEEKVVKAPKNEPVVESVEEPSSDDMPTAEAAEDVDKKINDLLANL